MPFFVIKSTLDFGNTEFDLEDFERYGQLSINQVESSETNGRILKPINFRYCTVEDFRNDTEIYNSVSNGIPDSLLCPQNSSLLSL